MNDVELPTTKRSAAEILMKSTMTRGKPIAGINGIEKARRISKIIARTMRTVEILSIVMTRKARKDNKRRVSYPVATRA